MPKKWFPIRKAVDATRVETNILLHPSHPLVQAERRMLKDPWVELVGPVDATQRAHSVNLSPSARSDTTDLTNGGLSGFWVIRLMRPRKPVTHYPHFVKVFEGWYQYNPPGNISEQFESVRRFYLAHRTKVIFHLRCSYDDAIALVTL